MKVSDLFFIIFFLLTSGSSFSQSLLDDFNRTDNATVGNGWSETETATSGAEISSNQLHMTTNSSSGREWVYQDVQASYETVFDNSTNNLIWCFNIQELCTTNAGFNDGENAAMVVLGASTSDYSTANGYGIAIGKQGHNFPLRLVRFDGGFDDNSKISELIHVGHYDDHYVSVKVEFHPTSGTWTLYAESNDVAYTDPTTVTTQVGYIVDANYSNLDLIYFGAFYNHDNNGGDQVYFDSFYLPDAASSNTTVQFVSSRSEIYEDGGTAVVSVAINNPDATNATSVDVVLIGGTATNGMDNQTYTTQNLTFPAGSQLHQSVSVTINDDSYTEATETLIFQLKNVSGGNGASIITPEQHILAIIENEYTQLMISEIADPSDNPQARFVELYNDHGNTIDFSMQTWYLSIQTNGHPNKWKDIQLTGSVMHGNLYLVANNQTEFQNSFGFVPDISNSDISGDGNDCYSLYFGGDHTSGTLVDIYGEENHNGSGEAWEYTDGNAERNADVDATNPAWTDTEWTIASPITVSELYPTDTSLPVELISFTATAGNKNVILNWVTASESDNQGYVIFRSTFEDGPFIEIASFKSNPELSGAGNSSNANYYTYTDYAVSNNIGYWYKLIDVNFYGTSTEHNLVYAMPNDLPEAFTLYQNYPNPFNPSTIIRFYIPDGKKDVVNVSLVIYNLYGQQVKTLIKDKLTPGLYKVKWDGTDDNEHQLSSGIYMYKIKGDYFTTAKRMVLIR